MKLFSIVVFLILYLYFYTPHIVVNIVYKIIFSKVSFTYIINYSKHDKISKIITYKFDHGFYDGSLIAKFIKQSRSEHKRLIRTPEYLYEDYQVVNYNLGNNVKKYSSFTYAVSSIIKKMQNYYHINYPTQQNINVGIIVSKRRLLKNSSMLGNFIRTVYYDINVNDSYDKICNIHDIAVKNEQKDIINLYNNGYDIYKLKKSDIIFNSHRELSYIERNDGNNLTLISDKNFKNKEDMENKMFKRGYKKMVFFNYLDEKWIIRTIETRNI